jgi:perosamine synthetase
LNRIIPLSKPQLTKAEFKKVNEVLKSGWLTHGEYNKKFESEFSNYTGAAHSITMNSCTSALHLALQVNNIKGEVILPSFTFVASANAIITAGAVPKFADIDERTWNIDPQDIERKITKKTQAIMCVHWGGQCCDMDQLLNLTKKHKLLLIEDSAETLGGSWRGQQAGSFGIGCFSFFPTKNITAGEGGMLTTNDPAMAKTIKAYVGHGIDSSTYSRKDKSNSWFRSASYAGYNFRMSNILAAIGYEQLKKIDQFNEIRRKRARLYTELLKDIDGIIVPFEAPEAHHVYQMYAIRLRKTINRNKFVSDLNQLGIGASVHFYPPVHRHTYYQKHGYGNVKLPVTEKVATTCVSLPIYPGLTKSDVVYITDAIKKLMRKT